jgi:BMFP domain-containing protein YqiC
VARGATSPLRDFFNQHFEMVKAEIRSVDAGAELQALHAVIADLEADVVEQSLYQGRVLARLRSDVEALDNRIAELERLIGRLTDVVAAAMLDDAPDEG